MAFLIYTNDGSELVYENATGGNFTIQSWGISGITEDLKKYVYNREYRLLGFTDIKNSNSLLPVGHYFQIPGDNEPSPDGLTTGAILYLVESYSVAENSELCVLRKGVLETLGNCIRFKTNTEDLMTPEQMIEKINNSNIITEQKNITNINTILFPIGKIWDANQNLFISGVGGAPGRDDCWEIGVENMTLLISLFSSSSIRYRPDLSDIRVYSKDDEWGANGQEIRIINLSPYMEVNQSTYGNAGFAAIPINKYPEMLNKENWSQINIVYDMD